MREKQSYNVPEAMSLWTSSDSTPQFNCGRRQRAWNCFALSHKELRLLINLICPGEDETFPAPLTSVDLFTPLICWVIFGNNSKVIQPSPKQFRSPPSWHRRLPLFSLRRSDVSFIVFLILTLLSLLSFSLGS